MPMTGLSKKTPVLLCGVGVDESLLPPHPAKASATHPVSSRIFICAPIDFIILHKANLVLSSKPSISSSILPNNTHMGNAINIFHIYLTMRSGGLILFAQLTASVIDGWI
ncbi:TPA: hypothetical protein I7787_05215 [Vibrio vulnificus]|nr:hypothetical protein [Vibrio vulnificus]HAS8623932.1 hypothetical protein [Vibrio vulnificus]